MKKNNGFTIAEMLISLFILCVIIVAATPILTHRAPSNSAMPVGSTDPVGTVIIWPSNNLPDGNDKGKWLECNGQSTAGYPELAKIVGTNVPDYRNVSIQGADNAGVKSQISLPAGLPANLNSTTNAATAAATSAATSAALQSAVKVYDNSETAQKTGTFESIIQTLFPSSNNQTQQNNNQANSQPQATNQNTQQNASVPTSQTQTITISVKYLIKAR